ncbi:DUF2778 domain-containing protein [Luteibacter sp.]|jgi:hypothetical protein|uniref:DUF2778 domain-containing protein n=1 Tax=Luteibacter sp. TaxID=1886636 RepID=UPI002F3EBAA1
MLDGVFKLKPDTALVIAGFSFPAFSGLGELRNRRTHMCVPNQGPIPVGMYYIVDRPEGRTFGLVHKLFKGDWFALYAKDKVIDDERYCAGLLRGQFRLHPKGSNGRSEGCITVEHQSDFDLLYSLLKQTGKESIPGTDFMTYGTVRVS